MRALVLAVLLVAGCASGRVAGVDGGDNDGGGGGPDATAIDAGIDAVPCANSPCDLYDQCGCTGTASVCDLDPSMLATGATACRSDESGGTEGTVCTRSTICAAGHSCVGGRCRRYCQDDATCPGDGGLCILSVTTGSTTIPGVTMCTTDCVPTSTTSPSCPANWACHVYFDQPGNRYLTDCSAPPASGGTAGATCARNEDCRPGLDCINLTPGGMQCRPTCTCAGTNCGVGTCPSGTGSCRGFTTPVTIGAATYGACF